MAISAELEALIAKIEDPKVREAQLKEAREGALRQDEFSRKMNALDLEKKNWRDWHEKTNKEFLTAQTAKDQAIGEANALRARIDSLEKASITPPGGDEIDPDDQKVLAKEAKRLEGLLNAANERAAKLEGDVTTLSKKLDSDVLTNDKYNEDVSKRGDRLGSAIFDVFDKQLEYQEQFGKKLDRSQRQEWRNNLIAEAQKRGGDLDAAYEFLTKTDRETKLRADIEGEYEKKYNDRVKGMNLPIDQGGIGAPIEGPLQRHLKKVDTGIPENIPADGTGVLSREIAKELIAEGKG